MLRVLPPTIQTVLRKRVRGRDMSVKREWLNAQHRFPTRLAAMLQKKLHVFVARFTVPLMSKTTVLHVHRAF